MTWHIGPDAAADYVAQRRSGSATAAIEAHLPACAPCRQLVADATTAVGDPLLELVWQRVTRELDTATRPLSERALTRLGVSTETARLVGATSRARVSFVLATLLTVAIALVAARGGRDEQFGAFLVIAALGPLAATVLAFGRRLDPAHAIVTTVPVTMWRIALLRTAASLVPAIAVTGVATLILRDRGWIALAWLLPGVAMALVSLALATWVPIEYAALGVGAAWVVGPFIAAVPAARLIDLTAGPGQLVALTAIGLAAIIAASRRSFLDYREA